MTVPREATQLRADELVGYNDLVLQLQHLETSPRVRVQRMGHTHAGRGLYAIVIADELVQANLGYYQHFARRLGQPQLLHNTLRQWETTPRPDVPDDMRYPVVLYGQSFGHEASHVEALLGVAERFAWSQEAAVQGILSRLIVVIMPMGNPDGRENALDLWRRVPLAEDSMVAGNAYGFYVNRDFLHLTQPEGRALIRAFREWSPLCLYDLHEDAFLLGLVRPETCWCPANGVATVEEASANIQKIVSELGRQIQKDWEACGYHPYHGDMFAFPMIGMSAAKPRWFAGGGAVSQASLYGIPAIITESARTPGTQTWEDRVGQKVSAANSILREVSQRANEIAATIYENGNNAIQTGRGDGYIIPAAQQDLAALARLIDTLLQHEILVYRMDSPQSAYVIPLAQPRAALVRELLDATTSKLMAIPPAAGLHVSQVSQLPEGEARVYRDVALKPVFEAPLPGFQIVIGNVQETSHLVIRNTSDGIRLINRLWRLQVPIRQIVQATHTQGWQAGSFLVESLSPEWVKPLAKGLYLSLSSPTPGTSLSVRALHKPMIGLYVGQGADRPDTVPKAELHWALEQLEFDFVLLHAPQIREGWLDHCDILLIPDGNAADIVHGWQAGSRANSNNWDLPGEADGIGTTGMDVIRNFIQAGGGYIGIGAGGGLLATGDYAGIINLAIVQSALGTGRVILQIEANQDPLVYGLAMEQNGDEKHFPALYYTETLAGDVGGPIFQTGEGVQVVARYANVDHDPEDHFIIHPEHFDITKKHVAIARGEFGEGHVVVLGVRPGFRAGWTHTLKLLTNAIFDYMADDVHVLSVP